MTRLKHPHIKNLFITIPDERVAAHVAAGWLETKPKRKSKKADAEEAEKTAEQDSPSPATDEAENNY